MRRLNSADRSFFLLVAAALVPYLLLGLFGCGLLSVLAYRIADHGLGGLTDNGSDLRPAAAFFLVVAIGTGIALRSVHRQVVATNALGAEVRARRVATSAAVQAAAGRTRLRGRVDVIDDRQPYSFTYGLWNPRVALSTGLVDALSPEELDAVLQHERYHVRSADTAKVVVARAAPPAFFFLPALRHLRDRYLMGRELAADRAAVRRTSDRAVAGALRAALDGPSWGQLGAAAALGGGSLAHRVEQLERGAEPPLAAVPRRAAWLTAAGLGALGVLFAVALTSAGTDLLSMDGSMRASGSGGVLQLLGGAACTAGMAAIVFLALARGRTRRAG
jgi:hypothetical protein